MIHGFSDAVNRYMCTDNATLRHEYKEVFLMAIPPYIHSEEIGLLLLLKLGRSKQRRIQDATYANIDPTRYGYAKGPSGGFLKGWPKINMNCNITRCSSAQR